MTRAAAPRALFALVACWLSIPVPASAFETFAAQVPCRAMATNSVGTSRPCITCHNNPDGGSGCPSPPCWNPFGAAFDANSRRWSSALAMLDSDGDGYSNGEELVDPNGTWTVAEPSPSNCACASRPGFPSYTPGDRDADGDGYCCRGRDTNADGDCLDSGEHQAVSDCNDDVGAVSPGATEVCSNTRDDDCDGLPTLLDPECASVLDRDGDGYCPMGRDANGNGNCLGSGEMTSDVDCDDTQVTVRPGFFENCLDGLDNDCNDLIDREDPSCTGDRDGDGDGYCPIGKDVNGDGDCLDPDEDTLGIDCNDMSAAANPEEAEVCTDEVDNDCDGDADFLDTTCRAYYDADGDGYCLAGRDGNSDRDCADAGEPSGTPDCNDADPQVSPGRGELCTNAIDDDCDMLVSLADPDCAPYLDGDRDRYCFVGFDMNSDRDCADVGESTGRGDCDDAVDVVNPEAEEMCTNGIDDDCDGSADAFDQPTCDDYRDRDGDGWCTAGRDTNDDGECADAGEQQSPNDAGHDNEPTVYPGAPENCIDDLDNDLDGEANEADACTSDRDEDGDGYCAFGRDLNGDGDCLDELENAYLSDCNDADAAIGPGATEDCLHNVDLDCDADIGLIDTDCFFLLDRDGDGFCGMGIDDNRNGNCLDEGENRFGVDCDDHDPMINARAAEICDNAIDDDCDGLIDAVDPSCPCTSDATCDDGNPCTRDLCTSGNCNHAVDPSCGDASAADGGPGGGGGGCSCRTTGRRSAPLWFLSLTIVALIRRRKRANQVAGPGTELLVSRRR